jgi:hypothetical protein
MGGSTSPLNSIWERLLGWLPAWLGFVLIIVAGIAVAVLGIVTNTKPIAFVAFGVAAIASALLAWWSGLRSEPTGDPTKRSFGGVISRVEGWVWWVVFGLIAVVAIIAIAVQ